MAGKMPPHNRCAVLYRQDKHPSEFYNVIVPFLAHNGQRNRVTMCHRTIPSRCHNKLPALVADLTLDIGRTSVFPQAIRFRKTMVAVRRATALKKSHSGLFFSQQVAQTTFLSFLRKHPNSIRNGFLCLLPRPCHPILIPTDDDIVVTITVRLPRGRGAFWWELLRILRHLIGMQKQSDLVGSLLRIYSTKILDLIICLQLMPQ